MPIKFLRKMGDSDRNLKQMSVASVAATKTAARPSAVQSFKCPPTVAPFKLQKQRAGSSVRHDRRPATAI